MTELTKEDVLQGPEANIESFGFVADENVKNITLAQLEKSIRVEGKHGRILQSRPVQSWNAISFILGLLETQNVNYKLESTYVQKRNSFPMLTDEEKALGFDRTNTPITKWLFDKVLSCIQLPNIGDNLTSARIGFGFSDDGIEVAFGLHVSVCQNFNILGGNVLRTYKQNNKEAASWESIEFGLKEWVASLEQKMKVEMAIMKNMQSHPVGPRSIEYIIGDLYKRAIDQAYVSKQLAPFDTAAMSLMTQNILKKPAGMIKSVWDLYNYGTSIIKPGTMDIAEIHTSSELFADYLIKEFEISKN